MSQRGQALERRVCMGRKLRRTRRKRRTRRRRVGLYLSLFDEKQSKCAEGHKRSIARRRRSLLSLTDRTSSWRRPGPGSAQTQETKSVINGFRCPRGKSQ